jgi:amidase/aspartyl-tRNA(Asn)/glutamyl-tRNA(Gln) amidotransferase subunit A
MVGLGTIPLINRPDAFSCTHPYPVAGGLTKSVKDSAILLNYMSRYDPLDPSSRFKTVDYVKELDKDISSKKIGYTTDFDLFEVDEEVKKKFLEEIEKFKSLGLKCEEIHFDFKYDANTFAEEWCKGITVDCAIELNLLKEKGIDLLKDYRDDFPEEFIYYKDKCDKMGISDLYKFNLVRSNVLDEMERIFKDYDFIISPVSCVVGVKNESNRNTKGPTSINGKEVEPLIGWTETYLANFVSYPSCSIPCSLFNNNMPFGIQIIGKKYLEEDLLALSYKYEQKYPWDKNYQVPLNREIK